MGRSLHYPQCRVTLSVVFDGFGGGDSEPTIVQVVPTECQVYLNGYKEADTWSMSFDARSLPFAPELVRALGVEIYMFDAGAVDPAHSPNNPLLGASLDSFATEANLMVAGLADNISIQMGEGGQTLTCDGRDYTALLLDRQWDPKGKVPQGKTISDVVQALVDKAVASDQQSGRTITVEYVNEKPEPVVGAAHSKAHAKGKPAKNDSNYWDIIYRMVLREGLICFVRGFNLIITDPQTLTTQNANKVAKVAYGRNLMDLSIERKLGKEKAPQVIVGCYSSTQRKNIEARFPDKKDKVMTGIGTNKDDQQRFAISGVDSEAQLKKIAETLYNNLARGESKITFRTKSLRDLGDQASPDGLELLKLRAGDPVAIGWDPFKSNETLLADIADKGQRKAHLRALGYTENIAELVAEGYDKMDKFTRAYYVKEVQVSWSIGDGISLSVEAINFVSVQRDDAAGEKAAETKVQSSMTTQPDPGSVSP